MGFSNRIIWLLVTVMAVSLAGLIGLQASLLRDAVRYNEASFRQNIQAALGFVAERLETGETIRATLSVVDSAGRGSLSIEHMIIENHRADSLAEPAASRLYFVRQAEVGSESRPDSSSGSRAQGQLYPDSGMIAVGRLIGNCDSTFGDTAMITRRYRADTIIWAGPYDSTGPGDSLLERFHLVDSNRANVVAEVLRCLVSEQDAPIEARIDTTSLDSLIGLALNEYGIAMTPVYGIIGRDDSTLRYEHPSGYSRELLASEFKAALFPHDLLTAPGSLALFFPERESYLFKKIGPMFLATFLFTLVVIGGFAYTIRQLFAQRRASRLMVDFVNNMTHEFKTPISTVALACEAIQRDDVITDAERVARLSGMIREENRRMRHQVEKILQMAALEEKQGELTLNEVNAHDVIKEAVDSIALRVEKRDGRIECDLKADWPVILADRIHLAGIIHNLLDNADKYSPENPHLTVRTTDTAGDLQIVIEDRGLGIAPEDKKRIFDKYFRVSKGNVHDVKGFGLGLSYVALMVKAHGGRITVNSDLGRGTRVILWFPIADTALFQGKETAE